VGVLDCRDRGLLGLNSLDGLRDPSLKLDELLHAHGRADNALTRIDEKEPEDIERHRDQARALD
jgi:hypothetical protein